MSLAKDDELIEAVCTENLKPADSGDEAHQGPGMNLLIRSAERDERVLIVFQLTFSKLTVLKMMLSDTSSWITCGALTQAAVAAKSLTSLLSPSASI